MTSAHPRKPTAARVLLWVARLSALAVLLLIMPFTFGEYGSGPAGWQEWAYLILFPFGFCAAYLAGWRWPLRAGVAAVACMALSLIVIGRTFEPRAYLVWVVLTMPGILYIVAALMLRRTTQTE